MSRVLFIVGAVNLASLVVACTPADDSARVPLAEADAIFLGESFQGVAGTAVAGAGDLDGDGYDDILVGAPEHGEDDLGAVFVYPGPVYGIQPLEHAPVRLVGVERNQRFGASLSAAGDVDGDGRADFLVGTEGHDTASPAAFLFTGLPATESSADEATARFHRIDDGFYVAGAGDVDGDGHDDILLGGPDSMHDGWHRAGTTYVVRGPVMGDVDMAQSDATLTGELALDQAGRVALGGDVNADGYDDVLVGAPGEGTVGRDTGAAYLLYGPVDGAVDLADADAKLLGVSTSGIAGYSVDIAPDVNGDGYDDLLVGAPEDSSVGPCAGAAYLVHGPAEGTSSLADADAALYGANELDRAGTSVAGVGDVNGDGYGDVVVGAKYAEEDAHLAGAAYLVLGPIAGTIDLGCADRIYVGTESDHAGTSVAAAGDVDADGFADFLVGGPSADLGNEAGGIAYLLLGGEIR